MDDEQIFKKPASPSKILGDGDERVFKKPSPPPQPQPQPQPQPEDRPDIVFKKPSPPPPSQPQPEDRPDIVFKKPSPPPPSPPPQLQPEDRPDIVFKKPSPPPPSPPPQLQPDDRSDIVFKKPSPPPKTFKYKENTKEIIFKKPSVPVSKTTLPLEEELQQQQQHGEGVFKKPFTPAHKPAIHQREEESVFKKPVSKTKPASDVEEREGESVFKKPVSKTKQASDVEESEEESVFKKPVSKTKPASDVEEREEESVFKKPVSKREEIDVNREDDGAFRKPVFITKAQRQARDEETNTTTTTTTTTAAATTAAVTITTNNKSSFKSPAQSLIEKSASIPYKEPKWSGMPPEEEYSFEVLKGGIIVDVISLRQPYVVIGRQSQCDIVLEHPSLSRFHCVIQYRSVAAAAAAAAESGGQDENTGTGTGTDGGGGGVGFYAYDLGSTHGSYHNKHRMKPHTYYRLRVGHMIKLGGSTRTLILQGPDEDQEPETEETATELMKAAEERKRRLERLEEGEEGNGRGKRSEEREKKREVEEEKEREVTWGMREDAEEEEEEEEDEDGEGEGEEGKRVKNPFGNVTEELYLDDPKKTLRGWFERHGYDPPNYTLEEISPGCCRCSVELPVESSGRGDLVVSVDHRGRRKDAVVQCALEACRTLDRRNLLRQANHEGHHLKKKRDWAENDYYDSDEDDFLDRTGDIQRRRLKRMRGMGKEGAGAGGRSDDAQTYDSLLKKYNETIQELGDIEEKLSEALTAAAAQRSTTTKTPPAAAAAAQDDLDSFMHSLKHQAPDKHKRVTWKLRAIELRKEELKLRRLVNIARPLGVHEMKPYQSKQGTVPGGTKSVLRRPGGGGGGGGGVTTNIGARLKSMKLLSTPSTHTKEPDYKVHKIFMEEEPKQKLNLRRLDDNDDDEKMKTERRRRKDGTSHQDRTAVTKTTHKLHKDTKTTSEPHTVTKTTLEPQTVTKTTSEPQTITKPTSEPHTVTKPTSEPQTVTKSSHQPETVTKSSHQDGTLTTKSSEKHSHQAEGEVTKSNQSIKEETSQVSSSSSRCGEESVEERISLVGGERESKRGREGTSLEVNRSEMEEDEGEETHSVERCSEERSVVGPPAEEKHNNNNNNSNNKRIRVLGPTLPPHITTKMQLKSQSNVVQPRRKERRRRKRYDEDDPNYDTWVPPQHQSGDGRTSLNDKLGY